MTKEDYFSELFRVLNKHGIETGIAERGRLPVMLDGRSAFRVEAGGILSYALEDARNPKADELYHQVAPIAAEVHEYMSAMENSARLYADSLDDEFKLLANVNGVVLAGRQMENDYGYKFVTWQWTYERTGLTLGHYYVDDYAAAKQDFAIRSGLIEKDKLFTPEQLTAIYRCVDGALEGAINNLTFDEKKELKDIKGQIADIIPDLDQRIDNIERTSESMQQSM